MITCIKELLWLDDQKCCIKNDYKHNSIDYCKDSICNDPKLILSSNVKGPNNKFVESGLKG